MKSAITTLLFSCFVLHAGVSSAQEADTEPGAEPDVEAPVDNVAAAIAADGRGKELFAAGNYNAAADEFRLSYELDPLPATLKSEVVSRFKAQDCVSTEKVFAAHGSELAMLPAHEQEDLAVISTDCALQRAQQSFSNDKLDEASTAVEEAASNDVKGRRTTEIGALRLKIESRQRKIAASDERERRAREEAAARAAAASERPTVEIAAPQPVPESPGQWQRVAGWSLVAVGGTFLVYQTAIGLFAHPAAFAEYERLRTEELPGCEGDACLEKRARAEQLFSRLDRWSSREVPIWIIGGALTAGGVATILLAGSPDESVSFRVGPGSVAIRASF